MGPKLWSGMLSAAAEGGEMVRFETSGAIDRRLEGVNSEDWSTCCKGTWYFYSFKPCAVDDGQYSDQETMDLIFLI